MNVLRDVLGVSCMIVAVFLTATAQERPAADLERQIRESLQEAVRAADDIPAFDERAYALAACGAPYALVGDSREATKCFEKAHLAVRKMPADTAAQVQLRCRLLTEIATTRAMVRDWGGARATLQLVDQERLADFGLNLDRDKEFTRALLAMHQAKAGLFAEADVTTKALERPDARDFAWSNIARQYAEVKQWENAHSAIRQIDQPQERASALAWIAEIEQRSGKKEEAYRSLDTATAMIRGLRRDDVARVRLQLAKTYGVMGDEKSALELSEGLPDDKFYVADRECVWAEIHAAKKDFAKALVHARKAKEVFPRHEYALRMVGSAQAKAGRFDDAFKTADEINDSWFRAQVLIDIALVQHAARQPDAAADTFRQVTRIVEQAPPPSNQFFSMRPQHYYVALAQSETGADQQARRWALSQISAANQAWGLLGVVEGLHQRREQQRKTEK